MLSEKQIREFTRRRIAETALGLGVVIWHPRPTRKPGKVSRYYNKGTPRASVI